QPLKNLKIADVDCAPVVSGFCICLRFGYCTGSKLAETAADARERTTAGSEQLALKRSLVFVCAISELTLHSGLVLFKSIGRDLDLSKQLRFVSLSPVQPGVLVLLSLIEC